MRTKLFFAMIGIRATSNFVKAQEYDPLAVQRNYDLIQNN